MPQGLCWSATMLPSHRTISLLSDGHAPSVATLERRAGSSQRGGGHHLDLVPQFLRFQGIERDAPLPRLHDDAIQGVRRVALGLRFRRYQEPVLGILVQGSAGASAPPACSSSSEMPSGVRMKAMRPSRGGRLIVTPCAMKALQVL